MSNSKYNGWSNFETWTIALEVFDGYNVEEGEPLWTAEACESFAEEVIFQSPHSDTLAESLARRFLAEVNWHEIADNLSEGDYLIPAPE